MVIRMVRLWMSDISLSNFSTSILDPSLGDSQIDSKLSKQRTVDTPHKDRNTVSRRYWSRSSGGTLSTSAIRVYRSSRVVAPSQSTKYRILNEEMTFLSCITARASVVLPIPPAPSMAIDLFLSSSICLIILALLVSRPIHVGGDGKTGREVLRV